MKQNLMGAPPASDVEQIALVGAGGVARELLQFVADIGAGGRPIACVALVVEPGFAASGASRQVPLLEGLGQLARYPDAAVVIAIGDTTVRRRLAVALAGARFSRALVHPSAVLGRNVAPGIGTFVGPGAIATTDVMIGQHVQVHAGATLGHDVLVGDFVTLAPRSTLSGHVQVGEGAFIGTGAVVLPGIRIGSGAVVGAGAVVTRNVPEEATVVGNPARPLDRRA